MSQQQRVEIKSGHLLALDSDEELALVRHALECLKVDVTDRRDYRELAQAVVTEKVEVVLDRLLTRAGAMPKSQQPTLPSEPTIPPEEEEEDRPEEPEEPEESETTQQYLDRLHRERMSDAEKSEEAWWLAQNPDKQ